MTASDASSTRPSRSEALAAASGEDREQKNSQAFLSPSAALAGGTPTLKLRFQFRVPRFPLNDKWFSTGNGTGNWKLNLILRNDRGDLKSGLTGQATTLENGKKETQSPMGSLVTVPLLLFSFG